MTPFTVCIYLCVAWWFSNVFFCSREGEGTMGQRVLKGQMELREKRYDFTHTIARAKHLWCFLHRLKLSLSRCVSTRNIITPQEGSLLISLMFQGEMGSEGLRGLPGESGNKGTKVGRKNCIIISLICISSNGHHTLFEFHSHPLHLLSTLSPLNRETMVCQAPEDHQGPQGSLGEM